MGKPKTVPTAEQAGSGPALFRDKRFRSRTLVLPDGQVTYVEQGQVAATNDALLEYLANHTDFEPLE